MIFDYKEFSESKKASILESNFFIVSTPIGNIEDITIRAIKILNSVDYIICENHEITKKLLNHYDINTNLLHYNDDMPIKYVAKVHEVIDSKKSIALVSDAGTPLISDPGHKIVAHAINHGYNIISIPGASSFVCALTCSGFTCDKFYFHGFLPKFENKIIDSLKILSKIKSLLIFFESPHRLAKTLEIFKSIFGSNKRISVSKEITKFYEETFRGTLEEVLQKLQMKNTIKGEYTVIVDNSEGLVNLNENTLEKVKVFIESLLSPNVSTKDIIQKVQNEYPEISKKDEFSKKNLYNLVLEKKKNLIV